MTSLILRSATLYMQPILLMFSVFLLLRGHNQPGGGFCGGLVAASAFALYAIAFSVAEARRIVHLTPQTIIGAGLLLAMGSATLPLLYGLPFMTGLWHDLDVPGMGIIHLGTPVFFDIGVYLDVFGVTLLIIFSMAEREEEESLEHLEANLEGDQ